MMLLLGGTLDKPIFKPEFYRELARDNPFGLTLHWREVESWFNHIAWPAYKTYSYKRHGQTVRRWWARASAKDLDRAREAMENVKMERAQVEQDTLTTNGHEATPQNVSALRKIMGGNGGEG
jgi:hypothetical protein